MDTRQTESLRLIGYQLEHEVGSDWNSAINEIKLAADQGNADGQATYGFFLFHGLGVVIDQELAVYYFKLAADQGNASGQNHYGLCLKNGMVLERM
jgi:TPR repeat protein